MENTIKCPKCGELFELTESAKHELEENIVNREKQKYEEKINEVREESKKKILKEVDDQYKSKIIELNKDSEEERQRNKKLIDQLEVLSDEIRKLRRKDEERELEMKKKLIDEEDKIIEETRNKTLEENELKNKEKDKKLTDALKQIEELRKKIQQGSQQTQGEVFEIELEELLRKEFPDDNIIEIKKGQRGADILQEVNDTKGRRCGSILWESKNAEWLESWITKLKEDQREAKADLAALVLAIPLKETQLYIYKNGIWISSRKVFMALAMVLRYTLIKVNYERIVNKGKKQKSEILFQYINSLDFKHRIEAIIENFNRLQEENEKEKRWFSQKWSRQDKQLRNVLDNINGMYGDLQGVVGNSLPDLKTLQLESGEE